MERLLHPVLLRGPGLCCTALSAIEQQMDGLAAQIKIFRFPFSGLTKREDDVVWAWLWGGP